MHGGKAKRAMANAQKRLARDEAATLLGVPRDVDPADALLEAVQESAGNVDVLRQRLQESERGERELTAVERAALSEAYADWSDRMAKVAKLAHDAGIDEARVRLQEREAELVAAAVTAALASPDLGFAPAVQAKARAAVGAHLRRLTTGEVVDTQ